MANPLQESLLELSTIAGDTTGDQVDIGEIRKAGLVRYDVHAKVGTFLLKVDTSPDGDTWRTVHTSQAQFGSDEVTVYPLSRFVRLSITGTSSMTISATIRAETLYCEPIDIDLFGIRKEATGEVMLEEKVMVCLAATDEAEGYIGGAYSLPITSWGRDLRMHTAKLAARYLLDVRGWDPGGIDNPIDIAHGRAIEWLNRVANGRLKPPDIQDSTPETFEGGSFVVSSAPRGW